MKKQGITIGSKSAIQLLDMDPTRIKWTSSLEQKAINQIKIHYEESSMVKTLYRPYTKKWMYYQKDLIHRPSKYLKHWGKDNIVLETTGKGISKKFSTLVSDLIPNYHTLDTGQGFMRYDNEIKPNELFEIDRDNITNSFAEKIDLSKNDVFSYIYGLLSSKEFQNKYANDLKKDLARIPIVRNKEKYVEIGKKLIDLHINYEQVPVYDNVELVRTGMTNYQVKKMKFSKKRNEEGKRIDDKSTIMFNDSITISNIPEKAYKYVVNGKSAIEWIMDQYQVKMDKKSGITDDPNDYSDDPKYIFNLLLRIINVSVQTVDLINQLPPLEIEE